MNRLIFAGVLTLVLSNVAAAEAPKAVTDALDSLIPTLKPDSVQESAMKGLYEAVFGSEVLYLSADGKHVFRGDLIDVATRENLTAAVKAKYRARLLAGVKDADKVVFEGKDAKHTVNVFTDIDCPYCVKFHKEIPALNEAGVTVKYLAFPRGGKRAPAFAKFENVFCADDRKQALTDAKFGKKVVSKSCDNPVAEEFSLGQRMGVTGTPTMFLDDGTKIPGYVPHQRLVKILEGDGN